MTICFRCLKLIPGRFDATELVLCKDCENLYFEQCFCDCCGRETKWDEWKDC